MMSTSSRNADVVREREILLDKLSQAKKSIELGITKMENSKKDRDKRKKEIVLKEMKCILAKLDEEDKKVMGELKSESLDMLRRCNMFEEEIKMISSSISVQGQVATDHEMLANYRSLQRRLDNVGFPSFADCLDLSVGSVPAGSMPLVEELTDSIFLKTPSFSGKSFLLVIPEKSPQFDRSNPDFNPKYLEVQVQAGRDCPFFHQFLLQRLTLTVTCQVQSSMGTGSSSYTMEESSLWSKMDRKEGEVVDGKTFKFFLKRPNSLCKISVKFLRSNISNSPLSYQFLNEAGTEETTRENFSVNETGVEIFDGEVSMRALTDEAPPQPMVTMLPSLPSLPSLPGQLFPSLAPPSPRTAQFYQLLQAQQIPSLPPPPVELPHPSDSSPFRPPSEAVSTMRQSAAAATLAEALQALEAVAGTELEPEDTQEPEKSILDPSKRSNLSVEEAQRSLSGSETSDRDRSTLGLEVEKHDKSVSFAPRVEMVAVLSTPQVAATGERYLVANCHTKEDDGQAGVQNVRRLSLQVSLLSSLCSS